MSEIIEISTNEEFIKEINSDIPVVVDFFAVWCNPCRLQTPILHEFKEEMGDKVKIIKVDVDQNEKVAYDYNITAIPTICIFKNGELKEKRVGLTIKSVLAELVLKHV